MKKVVASAVAVLTLARGAAAWTVGSTDCGNTNPGSYGLSYVFERINAGEGTASIDFSTSGVFVCDGAATSRFVTLDGAGRQVTLMGVYTMAFGAAISQVTFSNSDIVLCGGGSSVSSSLFHRSWLEAGSNATVRWNRFEGFLPRTAPAWITGSSDCVFDGNSFSNCSFSMLDRNRFESNTWAGLNTMYVFDRNELTGVECIDVSVAKSNRVEGGYLLGLQCRGDYNVVTNCVIEFGMSRTCEVRGAHNTIGGSYFRSTNAASVLISGSENLFCGNLIYETLHGVVVQGCSNTVKGCTIGLDPFTGMNPLPVRRHGIYVQNGVENRIGGPDSEDRNVIAGCAAAGMDYAGICIGGGSNNVVENFSVGIVPTGLGEGSCAGWGILLEYTSGNLIGGEISSNVICDNLSGGIQVTDSEDNTIRGTYIGVLPDDGTARGNWSVAAAHGIDLQGAEDTVIEACVIGSQTNGWGIRADECIGLTIQANWVGLNPSDEPRPNGEGGIYLSGCSTVLVGTGEAFAMNIISGNGGEGDGSGVLVGEGCRAVRILGNYIGVTSSGEGALGNSNHGVRVVGAAEVVIGGTGLVEGNVISGNAGAGILLDTNTVLGSVLGNYIGTDWSGRKGLTNGAGIVLNRASANRVGGSSRNHRNIVSANRGNGISILNGSCSTAVQGNYVGTGSGGTNRLGNGWHGIYVAGVGSVYSEWNAIGGTNSEDLSYREGNVIADNRTNGVHLATRAWENDVNGNFIGTDATGLLPLGNHGRGVYIYGDFNRIGLSQGNVIGANGDCGIEMDTAWYTEVRNNLVGIGRDLAATNLGNGSDGIYLGNGATFNDIGGTRTNGYNVIADNWGSGVAASSIQGGGICGNFIGVAPDGRRLPLNYGMGISVVRSTNTWVGGLAASEGNVVDGYAGIWFTNAVGCAAYNNYVGFYPGHSWTADYLRVGIHVGGGSGITLGQLDQANHVGNTYEAGIALVGTRNVSLRSARVGCETNAAGRYATNSGHGIVITNCTAIRVGDANESCSVGGSDIGLYIANSAGVTVRCARIGVTETNPPFVAPRNRGPGIRLERSHSSQVGDMASALFVNSISGNGSNGIEILGCRDVTIQGNHVGLDLSGTNVCGNQGHGIYVVSSTNIEIGGSVFSYNAVGGNALNGIHVAGFATGRSVRIRGNTIGLCTEDERPAPNGGHGVCLDNVPANEIGGLTAEEANWISANGGCGILVTGALARGNTVLRGRIGVSYLGEMALPNGAHGIGIAGAPGTQVGAPDCGNQVSGNREYGLLISGPGASNTFVGYNLVGTDADGEAAVPNGWGGIRIENASCNTIQVNTVGGHATNGIEICDTEPGEWATGNLLQGNYIGVGEWVLAISNGGSGVWIENAILNTVGPHNTIGANGANGIELDGAGAHGNVVVDNWIGYHPDRTNPAPNGAHGVLLGGGDFNRVGGTAAGEGNTIAFNAQNGVDVANGVGNRILGNRIWGNNSMGINLGAAGPGPAEQDGAPNRLQSYPAITNAFRGSTHVFGTLQSGTNSAYSLEIYTSDGPTPLGFTEGQTLLGRTNVVTDGSGRAAFAVVYGTTLATGKLITATATDTNGNTSEFSYPAAVVGEAPDSNADGIPDFYQAIYTNLNQAVTNDYDGDGQTDREEYVAGTNPEDAESFLRMAVGSLMIPVTSSGRFYTVENSTNLAGQAWSIYDESLGTDGQLVFTLRAATNTASEVFRARARIP